MQTNRLLGKRKTKIINQIGDLFMKKISIYTFALIAGMMLFSACTSQPETGTSVNESTSQDQLSITNATGEPMKQLSDFDKIESSSAIVHTSKGDIEVELFSDLAPVTVASFLTLARDKFYDGIIIHRVEPGFVIQAGDPLTKEEGTESRWGTGGPGYTIPDEFSDYKYDQEGILAMAKTMAPNSGGSQFFITLGPADFLNNNYTAFGKVISGMDIVKTIVVGDKITGIDLK